MGDDNGKLVEKLIGRRIRQLRNSEGVSQIALANRVGISFQQIQKYEKGSSRISVARLLQIADALDVQVTAFFQTEDAEEGASFAASAYASDELDSSPGARTREEKRLLRLFRKTSNDKVREGILALLQGTVEVEQARRESSSDRQTLYDGEG